MTRYFNNYDDAYAWVEMMMNHYDHYSVKSVGTEIQAMVF